MCKNETVQTLALVFLSQVSAITVAADAEALQLFNERIMPIFQSEKPSSCVQCHLASVDIKDYILPSHRDTFAALRSQGLVNVDQPAESKILKFIRMGDKDADTGARLIHEKTRKLELDAFSVWITACCSDRELRDATVPAETKIGPKQPLEIVRHARKSRIVESFARKIWSQRMRCFPCHTPHELDPDNPKHKVPTNRHAEFVRKFGKKMDIFRESPEATLDRLIASSRRKIPGRLPMLNLKSPQDSLLVLKPTSKLPARDEAKKFAKPSSKHPVSHMGGLKMHVNDPSYKSFVAWVQDYANLTQNKYVSVDQLPADNWKPTQKILRLKDIPESWGEHPVVQLFVFSQNAAGNGWASEPIAFTQGPVTPRRMVNGPLFLLNDASVGHSENDAHVLTKGKYLIKACVDRDNVLAADPAALLSTDTAVGELTVDAAWNTGWKQAEIHSATGLR